MIFLQKMSFIIIVKMTFNIGLLQIITRKAPQSKWSCMHRPNVRNLLVQMDDGQMDRLFHVNLDRPNRQRPMDRLCYVNLDRPNVRRSNGPSILRQFGPSKWPTVQLTVIHLDGSLDHLYYGDLDRPKLQLWTVILDRPKIQSRAVILVRPKLRLCTVILDVPN